MNDRLWIPKRMAVEEAAAIVEFAVFQPHGALAGWDIEVLVASTPGGGVVEFRGTDAGGATFSVLEAPLGSFREMLGFLEALEQELQPSTGDDVAQEMRHDGTRLSWGGIEVLCFEPGGERSEVHTKIEETELVIASPVLTLSELQRVVMPLAKVRRVPNG